MSHSSQSLLDRQARDRLINEHLGYVKAIAAKEKKSLSPRLDLEEMVAYGHRGLVEAAERFDPARGVAFTTFSYYRIRGAIYDGLRQLGWLSRSQYGRFRAAANSYMENQCDREQAVQGQPSSGQDNIQDLAETLNDLATIFLTSLGDRPQNEPADIRTQDSCQALECKETNEAVRNALIKLPEKERRIIELHYFQDLSLLEAGKRLGLSKSWSSRLHARAVRLLARELDHLAA